MTRLLALCLLLPACGAAATPAPSCPTAERGAWTVAWSGTDAKGKPILVTADICDEQLTDKANEAACHDRADAFNAELAQRGDLPIYFVTWSEE